MYVSADSSTHEGEGAQVRVYKKKLSWVTEENPLKQIPADTVTSIDRYADKPLHCKFPVRPITKFFTCRPTGCIVMVVSVLSPFTLSGGSGDAAWFIFTLAEDI